jgi:hypothetical protein
MDVVKLERGSECETSALPSLRNVQTIYIKCESYTTAVSPVVLQGDTKVSGDLTSKEIPVIHMECPLSAYQTYLFLLRCFGNINRFWMNFALYTNEMDLG